jgi:hypothetical protein
MVMAVMVGTERDALALGGTWPPATGTMPP